MVVDSLENAALYTSISPRIAAALEFLKSKDFTAEEPGRVDIIGDDCFALIQKYDSRLIDACKWESHQNYLDVQFVAAGVEEIGWAPKDSLAVKSEYNPEKDQTVHTGEGCFIKLTPGYFAILCPQDAHMPCKAAADGPEAVVKVVVKVKV